MEKGTMVRVVADGDMQGRIGWVVGYDPDDRNGWTTDVEFKGGDGASFAEEDLETLDPDYCDRDRWVEVG